MDVGLVFDAWVSYGRCDLAHHNRPMPKLDSQRFLNHLGLASHGPDLNACNAIPLFDQRAATAFHVFHASITCRVEQ